MIEWMTSNHVPAFLLGMGAFLIAFLIISGVRDRRLMAAMRARLSEADKRGARDMASLAESVNAVSQLSSSASMNAEKRVYQLSERLDARLEALTIANDAKLEQMRQTVDERLTGTLEKRLGQSFAQVSAQLEQVYKGLGEMRSLAGGVGDLKRVLQGVNTRGLWGEAQLGALLSEALTAGQYDENVSVVPGSAERVEYAVKLPGQGESGLYLPIDSKFPMEAYNRLNAAADAGDKAAYERAAVELSRTALEQAKKISDKYIKPPYTTDFAFMFVPVESLYAELLRRPGVFEQAQVKYRVVIAGPSTLLAMLSSLRMGFRALAVEQRTSEVFQLLGALKQDYGKFGDSLEKLRQRLAQAGDELDSAATRARAISRRLNELDKYSND